jgi:hypothetical protein
MARGCCFAVPGKSGKCRRNPTAITIKMVAVGVEKALQLGLRAAATEGSP